MFLYYRQKGIGGQVQDFYFCKLTKILSGGVMARHQTYHSTKLCKTRAVYPQRAQTEARQDDLPKDETGCCTGEEGHDAPVAQAQMQSIHQTSSDIQYRQI